MGKPEKKMGQFRYLWIACALFIVGLLAMRLMPAFGSTAPGRGGGGEPLRGPQGDAEQKAEPFQAMQSPQPAQREPTRPTPPSIRTPQRAGGLTPRRTGPLPAQPFGGKARGSQGTAASVHQASFASASNRPSHEEHKVVREQANSELVVRTPMPGQIVTVAAAVGQVVQEGDTLAVIEAMKMQILLRAAKAGRVTAVHISPGTNVASDQVIIELEDV